MSSSLARVSLSVAAVVVGLTLVACEGPGGGCESAADCGASETVCDACAIIGDTMCLEGVCEDRPADEVDVVATFNVDRDTAADVVSIAYIVAAQTAADGPFDCGSAIESGALAAKVSAYSTGFKALSGGSFHPDVGLGRAPDVPLALIVLATTDDAGSGTVIATGCSASFSSGDVLDIDP